MVTPWKGWQQGLSHLTWRPRVPRPFVWSVLCCALCCSSEKGEKRGFPGGKSELNSMAEM